MKNYLIINANGDFSRCINVVLDEKFRMAEEAQGVRYIELDETTNEVLDLPDDAITVDEQNVISIDPVKKAAHLANKAQEAQDKLIQSRSAEILRVLLSGNPAAIAALRAELGQ